MLNDNLQIAIIQKLSFDDFLKIRSIIHDEIFNYLLERYKKCVNILEKIYCGRRYYLKNNLTWVTRFDYHLVCGSKIYANIKYSDTYMKSQILLPYMNCHDKCHYTCTNCFNFYPSLFCLIMCRHFCNCSSCFQFAKKNIIGGFIMKKIGVTIKKN